MLKTTLSYFITPKISFLKIFRLSVSQRDKPPTHYMFKIQNFSLLSKKIGKYESSHFEAGGYSWKLVIYPNGNKIKGVKDHISLYLAIVDTESLPEGWDINVNLKVLLLDQRRDKYITVEGWNFRRFHALKTEWGFSRLIPLATFTDPSNGYLVDDSCVFGADVSVIKNLPKGECVSILKEPISFKHTWKVVHFSQLTEEISSGVFEGGGHEWKIQLHPLGDVEGAKDGSISVFIELDDAEAPEKVYASFKLSLRQQTSGKHYEMGGSNADWFTHSDDNWGWPTFMKIDYLKNSSNGFLVNDICIFDAEVTVHASVKDFP
ncbi:hypothetical protein ACHQM5_000089 [Ranunculus cassubicifolius]